MTPAEMRRDLLATLIVMPLGLALIAFIFGVLGQ